MYSNNMKYFWVNKKKILFAFITICGLLAMFVMTSFVRHDMVVNEFRWLISSLSQGNDCRLLEAKRNWYRIYKVQRLELDRLVNDDFKKYNYTGWQWFKDVYVLAGGYTLNGQECRILVNEKKNSDTFDFIKIFIYVDECKVILVYGRTYGI